MVTSVCGIRPRYSTRFMAISSTPQAPASVEVRGWALLWVGSECRLVSTLVIDTVHRLYELGGSVRSLCTEREVSQYSLSGLGGLRPRPGGESQ